MTQTLFDFEEGTRRKDAGMSRAAAGAGTPWQALAEVAVLQVAREKDEFTSDDIWATGLPKPPEPRALGAVMNRLARAHLIMKTGRYVKTSQASRNNAPIAVWTYGAGWLCP